MIDLFCGLGGVGFSGFRRLESWADIRHIYGGRIPRNSCCKMHDD